MILIGIFRLNLLFISSLSLKNSKKTYQYDITRSDIYQIMNFEQLKCNKFAENELSPEPSSTVASQFKPQFDKLTSNIDLDVSRAIQSLHRNGINYLPMTNFHPFCYKFEKVLPNYGFFNIHVNMAHFSLTLTSAKCPSTIFSFAQNTRGTNGNIFFVKLNNKELCLKGFRFKTQFQFQTIFNLVVKELTILKICSAIECSVNDQDFLGFDILMGENMIYFASERGKVISKLTIYQARQLREELRLMHEFKIIHFDIKADNIVYSQYYQKPVFIDFEFSQIIKEEIGFKTLTHFRGTPNFCTAELLAIIFEQNGYVNAYYNDTFGLDLVIKSSIKADFVEDSQQKQDVNQTRKLLTYQSRQLQSFLSLFSFKYYYLHANYQKTKQCMLFSIQIDDSNIKHILIFMRGVINFARIDRLLVQDLEKYSSLPQYKQIQEIIKTSRHNFFLVVALKKTLEILKQLGSKRNNI